MSKPFIKRLKISNFKSIDTLELHDIGPFSVFAGANGTGKSNFFDAIRFVGRIVRYGAGEAIKELGGVENFCHASDNGSSPDPIFAFEADFGFLTSEENSQIESSYSLEIYQNRQDFELEERLVESGNVTIDRTRDNVPQLRDSNGTGSLPKDYSSLLLHERSPVKILLSSIRLFRIDSDAARLPAMSSDYPLLVENGQNLAKVLYRMERDPALRDTIQEWMEFIVPSLEAVSTTVDRLDQRTTLQFKERFSSRIFPAGMVSDGTIIALSILVAVLEKSSTHSLTLIEEPERGLHPKAIGELIELIRDSSSGEHAIWATTHSETVVQNTYLEEFWMVDRKENCTVMKHASDGKLKDSDIRPIGMDEAWLSNLLGAGLPW